MTLTLQRKNGKMDFNEILKNMPALKDMAEKANENMKNLRVTGEAAAGMVKVTLNGSHEIITIEIDDEMMKVSEKASLIALLKGAHNVATKRLQERLQQSLFDMANKNLGQTNSK